jgi:hypothetical protein
VGGAFAVFYFWNALSSAPKEIVSRVLPLFKTGILTFVILTPLMIVSWESSGTPIYPPFPGNLVTEFMTFNTGKGFLADSLITFQWLAMPELLVMLLSFPLVFFLKASMRKVLFSFFIIFISICYFIGINSSASAATWNYDFYRFCFPMFFTAFLWVLSENVSQRQESVFFGPCTLTGVALAIFSIVQFVPALEEFKVKFAVLPSQERGFRFSASALKPYYEELQNKVPKGQKIFAVVDAPYLLDYTRNPISNVDNIASASPPRACRLKRDPMRLDSILKI